MKRVFILLFCTALFFNSRAQQNNLDYFVNQAIASSPLLKDFQNQILSFSLDSELLRAALKLQVNGISNNYYAPVIKGYGYDEVITNGQQISALAQVRSPFSADRMSAGPLSSPLSG